MEYTRTAWFRVPALVVSAMGLVLLSLGVGSSIAGADPGNGNGKGQANAQGVKAQGNNGNGNPCVTKGNDTASPPAGCDTSRPGGHSQGKVCPENHPKGKRVPAVDKGLSPDRPHGNAHGGTEVVCAGPTTDTTVPDDDDDDDTTTTIGGGDTTTGGGDTGTQVGGVTVQAPSGQEAARALPEELAFTGVSDSLGWQFAAGVGLMLLGCAMFVLPRTQLAAVVARRR